jgi:hypothetical protein
LKAIARCLFKLRRPFFWRASATARQRFWTLVLDLSLGPWTLGLVKARLRQENEPNGDSK